MMERRWVDLDGTGGGGGVGRCRQDLVPRGIRPSGMPMVPVLIHCRIIYIYIYLDAGASVSDAWVGTHADACNLTGRYIFAG